MSETFAGLCVGGPLTGKHYVGQRKLMEVDEPPSLKMALEMSLEDMPDSSIVTRRHTYTWTHIGPFALWLHHDTNLKQALEAMALAYQEKHT